MLDVLCLVCQTCLTHILCLICQMLDVLCLGCQILGVLTRLFTILFKHCLTHVLCLMCQMLDVLCLGCQTCGLRGPLHVTQIIHSTCVRCYTSYVLCVREIRRLTSDTCRVYDLRGSYTLHVSDVFFTSPKAYYSHHVYCVPWPGCRHSGHGTQ